MHILPIVAPADTFGSIWPELAMAAAAELRLFPSVEEAAELPTTNGPLPPILLVAGREDDGESDVRALCAAGMPRAIVVGAVPDHRYAIRMIRAGASDYFALPADLDTLRSLVQDLAERARSTSGRQRLLEAAREEYDFSQIVGDSPPIRGALDRAARIIPHDRASILLTGETGTGKELVARAIHFNGPRAGGAFVEINCAAIPANLLESELFGYERGAFTDARTAKPGLFEAAHGGTLFLDEVGHLHSGVQGKLLKAIEEKRVRRLGSLEAREVDTRIVAATHVDLQRAVSAGEFREDLFYRLAVIPIHLPPLRERGDDVLLIAEHFLRRLAEHYRLPLPPLDPALRRALLAHSWPGNVRELRNALERALLLGGGRLDPADLFLDQARATPPPGSSLPFPASLDRIEQEAARTMLERVNGNKSAAAAALGISRSRLYRLIEASAASASPERRPEK